MRVWKDDMKFMWYGRSGYHYQARFSYPLHREIAADRVKQFYFARRAVLKESTIERMRFTRGKRPWSWFMPSETRQPQIIEVTSSHENGVTTTDIDYHVTNHFGLLVAPCIFKREIDSLRVEMKKP